MMSSKVEKGKDISVLVEQAYPTCILVSFPHGNRTFRGVLLDESGKTSIISRTNPSELACKADSPDNLGLTTSRVTTCQSDMQHIPSGRMNTRSSAMMLRDGREGAIETPVHKIRGLVERLTQRPRKLTTKLQTDELQSSSDKGLKQSEAAQTTSQQESSTENSQSGKMNNNGVKRKRSDTSCEQSLLKAAKTADRLDNVHDDVLKQGTSDVSGASKQAVPKMPRSPLFPILKLKRTSYIDNSYVAVTTFKRVEPTLNSLQNGCTSSDSATDKVSSAEEQTSSGEHEHNTRFSARKKENDSAIGKTEQDERSNMTLAKKGPVTVIPKPQTTRSKAQVSNSNPEILKSKLQLLKSKLQTSNSKTQTLNNKPQILNNKPQTLNNKPQTLNNKPQTLNNKPQTLDNKPQTLDSKPQTLNSKPQTLNSKAQTLDSKPQTLKSDNGSTSKAKSVIQNMSRRYMNPKMVHNAMKVGDIAWGKVHGHPWWPCRVLGILCSGSQLDGTHQIVKVSWYGSPTTSDISSSLLLAFEENFKHMHKKQKRGAYQVAVREAQQELERYSFPGTQVLPA